jgi:ribosome-binding factor A
LNSPGFDRKVGQLCREVERTLAAAFAAADDPLVASLTVAEVAPAPDRAHLLVRVLAADAALADEILERLRRMQGYLRAEIAAAVNRKKTPFLSFLVVA